MKPIYTAPNAAAARTAFEELTERWGKKNGAVARLWENAWEEFIPFLDYDVAIRRVICSSNAIESPHARYRRAVKARSHFPTEQASLACLYLAIKSLDPTGAGNTRWAGRALETRSERLRHHLQRPIPGNRKLLNDHAGYTVEGYGSEREYRVATQPAGWFLGQVMEEGG